MAALLKNLGRLIRSSEAELTAASAWLDTLEVPAALVRSDGTINAVNQVWQADARLKTLVSVNGLAASRFPVSGHGPDTQLCLLDPKAASPAEPEVSEDFRSMLDGFQDCVKVLDDHGRLTYVNRAGRRFLGLSEDQPLGMKWSDLLPAASAAKVDSIVEQVIAGEAVSFSNYSQLPGSEARTWSHSVTPYRDHDGRVVAALCVSRDVTSAHDMQEAVRISEERLAKASKAAGLGIWDIDLRTDRLHCNDLWYDVTGIPHSQALTSMAQFFQYVHPEDVERLRAHWHTRDSVFDQHGEYKSAFRVIDSSGQARYIQATAAVIRDLAGQPIRAIGFVSRVQPPR